MKILHLANFNSTNIGNGALIFGTERVLREDVDKKIEFLHEAWDDYTFGLKKFDKKFVQMVNAVDALLVGGAVTFNGRKYLKNTGMRLDLPYNLWGKIKKPIIFYGVSYRVWRNQGYHNKSQLQTIMKYILNHPKILFYVRNDGTKEWLESLLGLHSDKIFELPDPALYVPIKDSLHLELQESKKNIIISLNNEDEEYRFESPAVKKHFLKELAKSVVEISKKYANLHFILCPHYFDDYKIISEFISFLPPRIVHQVTTASPLLKAIHASSFYDLYARADLALSMRVHSMSPSIGLGTPVIPIISQGRMSEFLDRAGLTDIAINLKDRNISRKTFLLMDKMLTHPSRFRKMLNKAVRSQRLQTQKCNQAIAQLLS